MQYSEEAGKQKVFAGTLALNELPSDWRNPFRAKGLCRGRVPPFIGKALQQRDRCGQAQHGHSGQSN
jgi:hypothetical protein